MIWGWLKCAVLGAAVLIALWLIVTGIYSAGYGKAKAEGQAALSALEARHAEQEAARWAVAAEAERAARARLQAEQARADDLAARLAQTENTLAVERRAFTKRIADATRNAPALTAASVRLYNEALYGPAGAGPGGQAGNPGHAANGAGPAPAAGGRVLPEQPVTLADLLAHARDYGGWCRNLQARERAWIDLSAGW